MVELAQPVGGYVMVKRYLTVLKILKLNNPHLERHSSSFNRVKMVEIKILFCPLSNFLLLQFGRPVTSDDNLNAL